MKVKYSLTARIYPAIINSIPFYLVQFFYLSPTLGQFWSGLITVKIASDATMILALLFLFIQVNRYLSKSLFQDRMFGKGLAFPTTNYLMHVDSHFSPQYTAQIHAKIKRDFNIDIPSKKVEEKDTLHARKIITEAVGRIRAKVGDGKLVLQHNAEYGFARNLAGGAVIALVMSIIDVALFIALHNLVVIWASGILAGIYLIILVFSKQMIAAFSHSYAQKLLEEYMAY